MLIGATSSGGDIFNNIIAGNAGISSAGTYRSTGGFEITNAATITDISISGDYSIPGEFSGQITEKGASYPLKLTIPGAGNYQFISTPTSAAIVGTYSIYLAGGEASNAAISASGAFGGTSSKGCIFSGTITPKTTGENAYNLTMIYGSAPCALPNYSGSGIALMEINKGGTQIWGGSMNTDRSKGDIFIAGKI